MKLIDVLIMIGIEVYQNKRNDLGNALLAELYWVNQRINFEKDVEELTDEEYKIIANVYIPKTINKKDKKYGYYDFVDEMKSIINTEIVKSKSK